MSASTDAALKQSATSSSDQPPKGGANPVVLPKQGVARVQSVLSGDTAVLLGRPTQPNQPPPAVLFTFASVTAPRLASKSTPADEPGAFPAREWLRKLVVGKSVRFQTLKQGASAGDRVYGWLFLEEPNTSSNGADGSSSSVHLALECVRQGHATPKALKFSQNIADTTNTSSNDAGNEPEELTPEQEYEQALLQAYKEAQEAKRGIHSDVPLVRSLKNAVEDFATLALVEACKKKGDKGKITCVVEHVFDGSRMRCQVTDPALPEFLYANFTLLLAGISCPRIGNPKADPPVAPEPCSDEARQFTLARLLQRELPVSLIGTDKSGGSAVGSVHHPKGNIAIELLKVGLARMTDWSVRLMEPATVPALRVAENNAKRSCLGVWASYAPPVLSSASEIQGIVFEVQSGDTLLILPDGKPYNSDDDLVKISLASIRAPRVGNERANRPDEPYSHECKERLRVLTIGRPVKVEVHYEREIPVQPEVTEKRAFGTVSVGKHPDLAELLCREGLATTQRHRDDDDRSPRYDDLILAENTAKESGKGLHSSNEYKRGAINDLTDPRKAKSYSGALIRAGTLKAVVDHVFNGALFKLYVPSENCYIRFAPNNIRCPQPSPPPGSKGSKAAEPFGDESKRHARLHMTQRQVEIDCKGVTNSGIIQGSMFVAPAGGQRRDYTIELIGAGLATVDQRKIDFGEAPKSLIDAQNTAKQNKVGIWSIEQPSEEVAVKVVEKSKEKTTNIRLSEIRAGNHFFYHTVKDPAPQVMEESMKKFTSKYGVAGAPCDPKVGKVVAAVFDDGTGKCWYRAKVIERKGPSKVSVLFIDHGNVATVPVATHLRPLDVSLTPERIPPVAKEAVLALTVCRSLDKDEGVEAARMLQSMCWGKDLSAVLLGPDENGKMATTLTRDGSDETVNAELIGSGLARVAKQPAIKVLASRMVDGSPVLKLATDLQAAEEAARKSRSGMWRYGDVGDDDEDGI
ncbi:hypothetical protein ACA910_003091 [Epithemia clementina (nom. ined.)]